MAGDDHGDDRDDDPQLKSLRAVWLEMRDSDEEPPQSGLAALMAAARVQADVMAKPPWWKRVAAVLRRPPVLALASVAVLIGGAVLITRNDAIEKATPTVPMTAPERERPAPARNSDLDLAPEHGMGSAAPAAPAVMPPRPERADDAKDVRTAPGPRHAEPVTAKPAPRRASDAPSGMTNEGAKQPTTGAAYEADKAPATKADTTTTTDGAGLASGERADAQAQTRAPAVVLVEQLAAQARGAAARGECENAKAIAQRIARQDPTYYREHVATEPAIARCIAPPVQAAPP
jgi:hypothetical protein